MLNALEAPRTIHVTVKLDRNHRDRLQSLAVVKKRTAHYLMKEAIERYLVLEEAQQKILSSVDDSASHFETTGLHITLDEARAWAKDVKLNPKATVPLCHI